MASGAPIRGREKLDLDLEPRVGDSSRWDRMRMASSANYATQRPQEEDISVAAPGLARRVQEPGDAPCKYRPPAGLFSSFPAKLRESPPFHPRQSRC